MICDAYKDETAEEEEEESDVVVVLLSSLPLSLVWRWRCCLLLHCSTELFFFLFFFSPCMELDFLYGFDLLKNLYII